MSHDKDKSASADNTISRRDLLKLGGAATVLGATTLSSNELEAAPLPQVPRRVLGKTNQKVPILLFGGAVALDPVFDPKLAEALRFGVNYIDAADCYTGGKCEPAVASFHKKAKARDKLWITSKSDEHDPASFEKRLQQSLDRLSTSKIDLYYLHALKDAAYLNKQMEKRAARLKKAGKIRYFGFSCHADNVVELMNKAAKMPWIDSIMFRYNFRRYGDKELNKAIDACAKANIGLIAMKTQGSEASFAKAWKRFHKSGKWTKHQAVLKAVWADKRISAVVSHMDTLEKLRENIAAALDKSKLTRRELEELHRYAAATRSLACDGCDHICGATIDEKVQIADTMRYLMYHDVYGEPERAKSLFNALPTAAQNLAAVDFAPAQKACPHGVNLQAHMARANDLFRG
jgi:uncharacterized protein